MQDLDGRVAVVTGGGDEMGRALALVLAARGCRVVVSGPEERSLGETVGEIAHGGGKARHVVGDASAALARAVEVFGAVDVIVHADARADAGATFEAAQDVEPGVVLCDALRADAEGESPERIAALVEQMLATKLCRRP